jgi:RecA-family ATPase
MLSESSVGNGGDSSQGPQQDNRALWSRIPQALRDRRQWAVAGPDKAPRTVGGGNASSTDPSTWTDFDSACKAAAERGLHVGYMLSTDDPFACIDLDVKDDTPPERWALFNNVVENLNSYSELSRSGKGMHVWVRANIGAGVKRDGVEVYSQDRFMICTGNVYRDAPIEDRSQMVANMVSQMRGAQHATAPAADEPERESDDAVLQRATTAANADKFKALWAGNESGYASHSEADMALVSLLAFYSPNNAQVKRLFRMSALGKRTKVTKDDRYLDRTLFVVRGRDQSKRSIEHGREVAERIVASAIAKAQAASKSGQQLLDELRVDWNGSDDAEVPDIVQGLVADEDVTLLGGHGGIGKSFLALQIACSVATGEPVLGHGTRPMRVLYYSAEDGRKRLTRRLRKMAEQFDYDPERLKQNLVVLDASELEPLYGEEMKGVGSGKPYFHKILGPTANFGNLQKMVEAFDAQLLVIDGASDTFDGNEIVRREVRAFIKLLRSTHPHRKIGILLMVHIDRSSARGYSSNDDGYSGNAAWHNSCRRRMYLQKKVAKDEDGGVMDETIVLRVMKNQDGPPEPDMQLTRDMNGLWTRAAQLSGDLAQPGEHAEDPADVILRLIDQYYRRGQWISTSLAPQSTAGVYATLKGDPGFPKLNRKQTDVIVRNLERDGSLVKEEYRRTAGGKDERWKVVHDVQYAAPGT